MLKHLELNNFKAWRKLDIEFGKVTGLFGVNSSGKSSVLQFLLLLKQTKDATDRGLVLDFGGPNQLVNLGTYEAIVHRGKKQDDIDWTLDWKPPETLELDGLPMDGKEVSYNADELQLSAQVGLKDVGQKAQRLSARRMKYRFAETDFGIAPKMKDVFDLESKDGSPRFIFQHNVGRPVDLPGPVKTHRFPDKARTSFQNTDFLSEFESRYESLMDRIFYLGPLRAYPQREFHFSGAAPDGVGRSGERTVDAILAATASGEKWKLPSLKRKTKGFQEIVAYWLKKLDLIHHFKIEEIKSGSTLYHALVKTDRFSPETMLTDVGFGVSQVLPVLVLLYYVPEDSIVLMEQPEIHLHPSVQSGLGDLMLEVAMTRKVQIIVESHSEHLLRRFQRRVAEEDVLDLNLRVSSSDLKLYFVETNQGKADLKALQLNEYGGIENWPDNFFGNEMEEITATSKAALNRRIEAEKAEKPDGVSK